MGIRMLPPLEEEVLLIMRYLLWAYKKHPASEENPADRHPKGRVTPLEHEVNTGSQVYPLLWGELPWNGEIGRDECYELGASFAAILKLLYDHHVDVDCYMRLPEKGVTNPFESEMMNDMLRSCRDATKQAYTELIEKRAIVLKLQEAWQLVETFFVAYGTGLGDLADEAKRRRADVRATVTQGAGQFRFLTLPTFLYHRTALHRFFLSYLDDYLRAFKEGKIDWDPKNMWRWEKQKEYMLNCLHGNQENYGETFWLRSFSASMGSVAYITTPEECRPLEALFALERDGLVNIEKFIVKAPWSASEYKVTMLPQQDGEAAQSSPKDLFSFMGTVTDFSMFLLFQEGHPEKHQKMKTGKQRYPWQFLRTIYGAKPQPLTAAERYVSEKLGRPVTITEKDCENLITTLPSFAPHSREEIRSAFVTGETIGLKKIDSI